MNITIRTFANRKAVIVCTKKENILFSYDTRIATVKNETGELIRNCEEWALTNTTMRHLREFVPGIHKQDFLKVKYVNSFYN